MVVFAIWNTYVWVTFVRNVYPDHHWDGFFIVHLLIGSLTTAMGLVVGAIGLRGVRGRTSPDPS